LNASQQGVDLQEFLADFFRQFGAMVERPSYALLEVLLPDDFPWEEEDELLHLAFDPEVAEEEDAEFVTYGSPLLDKVTDTVLEKPKVNHWRLSLRSVKLPENVVDRIRNKFTFLNYKFSKLRESRTEDHAFLEFVFQIRLISDEREELQEKVLVDPVLGCRNPTISEELEKSFFTEREREQEVVRPTPSIISLEKALSLAREGARRKALEHKERFEKRLGHFRDEELEKVKTFFRETEANLKERLEKLGETERDEKRKETLRKKIEANRADRRRRIEDVREKYSCEVHVSCDQLRCYSFPRHRLRLVLERKGDKNWLDLFYNPLLHQLEVPTCAQCGQPTSSIFLVEGKPYCQSCGKSLT